MRACGGRNPEWRWEVTAVVGQKLERRAEVIAAMGWKPEKV